MRPGGVYLVQQPEIHLHPDAQAGLADFFIYLASHGVITIVETHSEYLLLRIRRRLAEGAPPVTMGTPTERPQIQTLRSSDVSVLFTGFERKKSSRKAAPHWWWCFSVRELAIGVHIPSLRRPVSTFECCNQEKCLTVSLARR